MHAVGDIVYVHTCTVGVYSTYVCMYEHAASVVCVHVL